MTHPIVRQNKIRVYVSMILLTGLLGLLGTFLSAIFHWGLSGTGVFLIIAGVINLVAFYFSDRLILRVSGCRRLQREQAPQWFAMVEELCRADHLPVPTLYLIEEEAMNAFATGRDPAHAAVAATRGLLEKLTPDEVKAVVAHELSHIKHHDMRLMAVVAILAGLISILADVCWRQNLASKFEGRDQSGVLAWVGVLLSLFAPLSAMFIQLAISRRRELLADAAGAELVQNPAGLISALKKIHMDRRPLVRANPATAHIYFAHPSKAAGALDRLFSTHPPLEERVLQLESLARRPAIGAARP